MLVAFSPSRTRTKEPYAEIGRGVAATSPRPWSVPSASSSWSSRRLLQPVPQPKAVVR